MTMQNTKENLKGIDELVTHHVLFNMAVSHLFHNGMASFTEEAYRESLKEIEQRHEQARKDKKSLFMSMRWEKAIQETAYQLSKYPVPNILLYIKKHVLMYDPETPAPADTDDEDCDGD